MSDKVFVTRAAAPWSQRKDSPQEQFYECSSCGGRTARDHRFCPYCGVQFTGEVEETR